MKTRSVFAGVACALLLGAVPLASAGDMSLNSFRNHALPVLVTVNSQGKITEMSPAYPLRPRVKRLLRTTLDQMITGPAKNHGKAIASQAVIQLAVEAAPQQDGKYKMHFAYIKAMPVPYGNWFWNHIDGHRLALQSDSGRMHRFPRHYLQRWRAYPRTYSREPSRTASQNRPQPVQQRSAPMRRPAPVSHAGERH